MKQLLVDDWRKVLRFSWSLRFLVLAALLSGVEASLTLVGPWLPISTGWLAVATLLAATLGALSRLLAQRSISGVPAAQKGSTQNG